MGHFVIVMMLAMCCILFCSVFGTPSVDSGTVEIARNRTKRHIWDHVHHWDYEHASVNNLFGRGGFMYNKCVEWFGCYKGYCWAGCTRLGFFDEWCYTENEGKPVRCKRLSDCHGCWNCHGSCTITDFFDP